MTKTLIQAIEEAKSIGISGHIRPDGDCIGSTVGLYNYVRKNYPDKLCRLYLEQIPAEIKNAIDAPDTLDGTDDETVFELFVSLDSSSPDRLGPNQALFERAKLKYVIDHHKTNTFFGDINIVADEMGACAEVLFDLLDYEKMDLSIAAPLYLGIVHDTGVFKYSSTKRHTMETAGKLLELGVDAAKIIDGTFYEKSWNQNKLLALALNKAELYQDGYTAVTIITRADLESVCCKMTETDGIVEQLRLTRGVEIAAFIREDGDNFYKISLRSKNGEIDVSQIAVRYGGGGHERAAGFNVNGDINVFVKELLDQISGMKDH